jgi:hypothetical protein
VRRLRSISYHLMSGSTVEGHKDELKDYDASKGDIRFSIEQAMPVALVRRPVKVSNRGERRNLRI